MSSASAATLVTAVSAAASPAVAPVKAILPSVIPSALNNIQTVGTVWMLSSAIFTTYSTTKFLKFSEDDSSQITSQQHRRRRRPRNRTRERSGILTATLPRATLLTLLRFSGSLVLGMTVHPNFRIASRIRETFALAPSFALPAIFLFVANYSNSISLSRIGISLTYTSKCAIPLVTLLLTILLDGFDALPRLPVLLTLLPIAGGIATASWNAPTFEPIGFLSAMISCTAQSALNVTCKRTMNKLGVGGTTAQRAMVAVGLLIASTVSFVQVLTTATKNNSKTSHDLQDTPTTTNPPLWLSTMAVTAYHVEYLLSFAFVGLVAPITYSACDAVRRLGIIISGHFMFGGAPFTSLNIVGILMALCGALGYSVLNH